MAIIGGRPESPAMEILQLLRQRGARLSYCDPYVPTVAAGELLLASQELTPELLQRSDCVVVVTNHREFDWDMVAREAALVVDTRNATRHCARSGSVYFL